ncbi:Universal stress protein PHOS34 [Sesamum alatum]|uniref:Universal stress protein PHOS34 n=1 Tax=Sesamum alatum TaxID=300844 RepID=A0AAE1YZE0_9LAMI|nr:Universal stress protein PHOS34 [Sesamum alatum]
MASAPPAAAAAVVVDHPKHDLQPVQVKTSSPRFPPPAGTPTSSTASSPFHRRIGIAVDLSEESAYAVKWAVDNYLRLGDTVILLHVLSTSVLYGADWGPTTPTTPTSDNSFSVTPPEQTEEEYDNFTAAQANILSQPLVDAHMPVKIHIVKDHDMKERLCLEVERLGLSAVIMGSRGIGASRRSSNGKLGSVSDYCVQHCACPVVVVRYNKEEKAAAKKEKREYHDAVDRKK